MASIVKRNNRYCVVYTYKHTNGTLKQKWETFTDLADTISFCWTAPLPLGC